MPSSFCRERIVVCRQPPSLFLFLFYKPILLLLPSLERHIYSIPYFFFLMASSVSPSLLHHLTDIECFFPQCIDHIVAEANLRADAAGLSRVYLIGESDSPCGLADRLVLALTSRLSVPVTYVSFSQLDSLANRAECREELQRSLQVEITAANLQDIATRPPSAILYARIALAYHSIYRPRSS